MLPDAPVISEFLFTYMRHFVCSSPMNFPVFPQGTDYILSLSFSCRAYPLPPPKLAAYFLPE